MSKTTIPLVLFSIAFSFAAIAENEDYILIDSGSCPSSYVESTDVIESVCDTCSCSSGYVEFTGKTTNSSDDNGDFTYECGPSTTES